MDPFLNPPPADSLAAARLHVQALTECGLSREALLRALLENYEPSEGDATVGTTEVAAFPQIQQPTLQDVQGAQGVRSVRGKTGHGSYNTRLSVSTTSSRSSGKASVFSAAASVSTVASSHAGQQDMVMSTPGSTSASTPTSATTTTATAPPAKSNNRGTSKSQGHFWCTFCDVAFQRKFDWKRHEDEFHERYKRYPCPNCNRIFWGANTFNQHHKNAHGCTTCPHADQVVKYTQRKQAWACGFCGGFLASRDRYFDHVARHYEDGCNKSHWNHSLVIYGLLHQPSITHTWKELDTELYGHLPRAHQPMLEWDPKVTGHAQGFLEGDSPGKLQDLLEFFNDTRDDPRFIARLAHDQATIRFRNELPAAVSAPAPRPISEPPRSKMKSLLPLASSSTPSSSLFSFSKHMSAPLSQQQQHPQIQPQPQTPQTNKLSNLYNFPNVHQTPYDDYHAQKKQRSLAPAPPTATLPSQHLSHPQQPQLDQHTLMSSFPQTIVEGTETNFFNLTVASQQQQQQQHSQDHIMGGLHTQTQTQSHQHHHQHHPHHQHPQQQQQQPQQQHQQHQLQQPFLVIPTLSENMFEDWSSMTATIVDDAAFSVAEGWDMTLRSSHMGMSS